MFNSSRYVFARFFCMCDLGFFSFLLTFFHSFNEWLTISSVNSIARAFIAHHHQSKHTHTHVGNWEENYAKWTVLWWINFFLLHFAHTHMQSQTIHIIINDVYRHHECLNYVHDELMLKTPIVAFCMMESHSHMHLPHGICCKSLKLNDRR